MLPTSSAMTSMRGGSSCVGRPGCSRAAGWGWCGVERSVGGLDGAVEVGRRQHGEDVGLQDDDQQLEEGHDQRHQERGSAEDRHDPAGAEQVHRAEGEDHEQHRSEEHTSELQSRQYLVCRLLLEKKTTICLYI